MEEFQGKIDCTLRVTLKELLACWVFLPFLFSCELPAKDTGWINSSDRQLQRLAERVLPDVIESSGLEILEQIHVDYRTAEEMSDYIRSRLEKDLPKSKEGYVVESYQLFGLFPVGLDLRQTLAKLYEEQVIGFYAPKDKTLYLQEGVPLQNVESLLVHEMVHALQDQHFNLDDMTEAAQNNDQLAAVMAAIEGHATVAMLEFLSKKNDGNTLEIEDVMEFGESILRAFESPDMEKEELESVPLVLRETMLFPYIEGARFAQLMREKTGTQSVPFESKLPKSTKQVLHFDGRDIEGMGVPTSIEIKPNHDWNKLYQDTLGELEVSFFLENLTGRKSPIEGWRGDSFALLEGTKGSRTLVWFSLWNSVEDRDNFSRIVGFHMESMEGNVRLASVTIEGMPGLEMQIGPEAKVEVSLERN